MAIYEVKLTRRQEIASETMAFHFEKPKGFAYKAGQFCDLTLLDPPETDEEGNTRGFTLASAPFENELMVATRMRDTAFKRTLKTVDLGTKLKPDAPYGSFTLHANTDIPAVFLAGGIGITPARSIVLQATHDKTRHTIILFYSNRSPEASAFLDELMMFKRQNPNFRLIATMTGMEQPNARWSGETGVINGEMIAASVPALERPIFYISGPQSMVVAMRKVLDDLGVQDDKIRTEEFAGY